MPSSPRTTLSTLRNLALALMLSVSISSCRTTKQIELVEHHTQDSICITQLHHDSIYIYECKERIHDTLILTKQEYRYKMLRDTVCIVKIDSIPVVHTVVEVKEVRHIPPWCKYLSALGAIALLLLLIIILRKIKII